MVDWNNDGMLDLIVGDRNGYVNHFRRTSNSPITLTQMPKIQCAGTDIDVGNNSAPAVVDWNENGLLDLLVGSEAGTVRLYLNDGGDSVPVFSSYSLIQNGSSNLSHYRGTPQVFDLNGDGKKDLLVGANDKNIYFYENKGTNASPSFSGNIILFTMPNAGARLWVNDWNQNGFPDILASDFDGYVYVYLQNTTGLEHGGAPVPFRELRAQENPFRGSAVITGAGFGPGVIEIFDLSGRRVLHEPFAGSLVWDAGEVPMGTYMARVTDEAGSAVLRMVRL